MLNANIGKLENVRQYSSDVATLTTADAINIALVDDNDIELYTKTVMSIFLNTLAIDSALSAHDSTTLQSIAAMNWYQAGNSIYLAAAMLGMEIHPVVEPEPGARLSNTVVNEKDDKETTESITLMPNPVNTVLTITGLKADDNTLTVYDGTGKCIYKTNVRSGQLSLNVSSYPAGIYLLITQSPSGSIHKAKFAVMR